MSNSQPPPEASNGAAESDQFGGGNHIPPDPLLETGSFIDPDVVQENGQVHHNTDSAASASAYAVDATPISSRRPRRTLELAEAADRPDWLPEDWSMTFKTRHSGATAGIVDRPGLYSAKETLMDYKYKLLHLVMRDFLEITVNYYIEPVSGRRFRSKNEVLHFLETGSKMKKKPTADSDDVRSGSAGAGARKRKNSTSKTKEPSGFSFDFSNPPDKVTFNLEDAEEDRWSASVDGEKVPESTQKEWAAVFDHLSNVA